MTESFYLDNCGLIRFWARIYGKWLENSAVVDIDDLMQAGALGLMQAEKTYQPDKGAWSSWASFYIRAAMLAALEMHGGKPAPIAVSLDAPTHTKNGDPSDVTLLETIVDTSCPDMDDLLLENEVVQTVREVVAALPEDQQRITRLHDLQGNSYAACDHMLDLEPGTARRINSRTLRQLAKNRKLRALVAIDQETIFYRYKGVYAFNSSGSSVVEDVVIWRMEKERCARLDDMGEANA